MNAILLILLGGFLVLSRNDSSINGVSIKKSTWFAPYIENKNGVLRASIPGEWSGRSGVYFIKDPNNEIIYVGSSTSQLKKTIYRHFQTWTDRQRSNNRMFDRVTYPKTGYKIKYILCSPADALRAEKYFIQKLHPRDNPIKYYGLTFTEKKENEAVSNKITDSDTVNYKDLPF